jgi:hypothetical protein
MRYRAIAMLAVMALGWSGAARAQGRPAPKGTTTQSLPQSLIKKYKLTVTYTVLDGWNVMPVTDPNVSFTCFAGGPPAQRAVDRRRR